MPQFDVAQAVPQIVWLALVFGVLYLLVVRTVPRVRRVIERRRERIAGELSAAEAARQEAEAAVAGGSAQVGEARALAQRLVGEARRRAEAEVAARLRTAEAAIAERLAAEEAELARARAEVLAELDRIAAEAARDLVRRVAGLEPDDHEAAEAVRRVAA
ncbi:MAG: ATPase [Sphingomonadaceae bacterium]|uniref:F0F1 ATP synthase subunit B family protein n=1 Tax=Thermaurantiacus sp. TaxID=2820283 RepID=UPI00298F0C70|nr:ATPase [Thermaurantiacus sp.]MCS6987876.1 ATPase [Sphingomonadaceae bacterium]MDW8414904.1 ATPase [Thermaurantiacus sp.]